MDLSGEFLNMVFFFNITEVMVLKLSRTYLSPLLIIHVHGHSHISTHVVLDLLAKV